MNSSTQPSNPRQRERFSISIAVGFCIFLAIAVFFLWQEHRTHGLLPVALLVLSLLIYSFMHRGHAGHDHNDSGNQSHVRNPSEGGLP